jgi:hypothetical protein
MTTPALIDHHLYVAAMEAFERHRKKPASRVGPWVLDILDQCGWDAENPEIGPEQARAKALKALSGEIPRQGKVSFPDERALVTRYNSLMNEIRPIWQHWTHPGARDAALRPVLKRWQGKAWTGPLPSGHMPSEFAQKCLGATEERLRRARRNLETDEAQASSVFGSIFSQVERLPDGKLRRRQPSS